MARRFPRTSASLLVAAVVGIGSGSCGRSEVRWTYESCAQSRRPTGGSLGQSALVRADTELWAKRSKDFGLGVLPKQLPAGDLRMRVWHSTRFDLVETGLELRREGGRWSAWRYDQVDATDRVCPELRSGAGSHMCARRVELPSHWPRVWDALVWVGLTELEGDAWLDGERLREPVAGWWFVEMVEGSRQHAYAFSDPEGEACRQSEAFARGLNLLGRELGFGPVKG